MIQKISAKEYFFSMIVPEEEGKRYHENYRFDIKQIDFSQHEGIEQSDDFGSRKDAWRPKNSNDYLIDELLQKLIDRNSGDLHDALESSFVGKCRLNYANASALIKNDDYTGNLVIFNVGLSVAAYQYCALYDEHNTLFDKIINRDYGAAKRFAKSTEMLLNAQHRWNAAGHFIQLAPDDMLHASNVQRAANLATFTDMFIIAHEIAHHVLGHTDNRTQLLNSLLKNKNYALKDRNNIPEQWGQEIDADTLAIGIIIGDSKQIQEEGYIQAALGALLVFLALGHLEGDFNRETESHPPLSLRTENILQILSNNYGELENYLHPIHRDISRFNGAIERIKARKIKTQ